MSIAVLFLARGIGGGVPAVSRFLQPYHRHPAGHTHQLYGLLKGWEGVEGKDIACAMLAGAGGRIVDLPDDGLDWGAYFRAAECVTEEWICCFNTHSRIEREGWLALLLGGSEVSHVGAIGCTGSWGTIAPVAQFIWPIVRDVTANKGLLKGTIAAMGSWSMLPWQWMRSVKCFAGFPNPHLRSNAFLVRRTDLCAFAAGQCFPRTKNDAFALESGRNGLTRFLEARHRVTRVAGADGTFYSPEQWIDSRTFRVPGQENLIISDNQTRNYETLGRYERRIMELSAWGRFFTP